QNTIDANISTPLITWTGYYSIVNAANLIIKYAPGVSFSTEASRNDFLAQAYTMRAYVYFLMARTWGELPIRTTPLEDYNFEAVQIPKSSLTEVFALIKSDIEKALQLFPANTFQTGRNLWSKPAANALKADLYLWTAKRMGGGSADLTTALDACNAAQTADATLLPAFSTIFDYNNKGNKEVLMAVNYVAVEAIDNYFFNGWLSVTTAYVATTDPAGKAAVGQLGGNNIWSPSALVRNQFTTDDQRRNATFIEVYNINPTSGAKTVFGSVINKGDGTVISGTRYFADDIILYRYADVLLLKAEAKNGLGQDPSAEINLVRQRAYGTAFSAHIFQNGTKEVNDAAILQERLFELAYEGKRWWDLVRFGKAFDLVPSLQSNRGKDYLLLNPINALTLSLEPKVTQNPGYN
ncbi:MAG: RagB/SusD family nutrient uptake outer membrane protein, partial [Chitinophagaceae bacterium]